MATILQPQSGQPTPDNDASTTRATNRLGASAVACCLDPDLFARVERAIPGVRRAGAARELADLPSTTGVQLIIADPMLENGACTDEMLRAHSAHQSLVMAAYTRFVPAAVPRLMRLAAAGVADVVIFATDDHPERFATLLARATAHPYGQAMVEALEGNLARLPQALRDAIGDMYASPMRIRGGADLAAAAGITRTTMYAHLADAGLGSARRLVGSGRVVRAVAMLQDRGVTIARVSERLRYHRPEQLSASVLEIAGDRPRELRRIEPRALARSIASRLQSAG